MVDYRHPARGRAATPPAPSPPAATRPPSAIPGGQDVPASLGLPVVQAGPVDYRHPRRRPSPPPRTRGLVAPSRRGWALRELADGSPLRFDPALPIRVTVNTDQAGRWALDDLEEALGRVSQATGLRFEPEGLTGLIPQQHEHIVMDPLRPTLTVAWAKPGAVPGGSDLLPPEEDPHPGKPLSLAVGVAHTRVAATPVPGGVRVAIARAVVVLDSSVRELYPPGFRMGACRGAVLLHELAHAVGLDHCEDRDQLMFPFVSEKPARFGAGDLEGLRRVGAEAGPLPILPAASPDPADRQ